MAEAHPIELRTRVVAAYESGLGSYPEVADQLDVGEASVKRWVRLKRRDGDVAPTAKAGGRMSKITLGDVEVALSTIRDATAGELTAEFNRALEDGANPHILETRVTHTAV